MSFQMITDVNLVDSFSNKGKAIRFFWDKSYKVFVIILII